MPLNQRIVNRIRVDTRFSVKVCLRLILKLMHASIVEQVELAVLLAIGLCRVRKSGLGARVFGLFLLHLLLAFTQHGAGRKFVVGDCVEVAEVCFVPSGFLGVFFSAVNILALLLR